MTISPEKLADGYRITSIQGLRGLAACLVAAMHCLSSKNGLVDVSSPLRHQVTMAFCAVGGAGVDIFFVISGFIILTLAQRRVSEGNRFGEAWRFLIRRLGRIYPLYWVTVAVILAVARWYMRGDPNYHSSIDVSELLLTTTKLTVQPPAWTLAFELWFYLGSAALMLLPTRLFTRAMMVWAITQAIVLTAHTAFGIGPDWYIFIQPQVMDFFLGCAVAHACAGRMLSPPRAVALLLVSMGIFIAGCAVCYLRLPTGSLSPVERLIYWGIAAAILLWSLVSLELRAVLRTPVWLQRLGDDSYSIYLWHFPVMAIAFSFGLEEMISSHKLLQAVLEFLVTIPIAFISYRVIERPTMRLVHSMSRRRRKPALQPE